MSRSSNSRRRSGFSLIEVVIAVLVISILAAVAAPTYVRSMSRFQAEATARRIVADLKYARQEAMNQGVAQDVVFVTLSNSYSVPNAMHPDNPNNVYAIDLSETEYPATLVSADFGGSATVTFDIVGRPSSAGTVVVASGANQRVVTLDSITGFASVQ